MWYGLGALVALMPMVLRTAYRAMPRLSQDWRIVTTGNPDSWRSGQTQAVVIWLVRRFRSVKASYTTIGNESRVRVGSVEVDDPDFDEHLAELRFKAEEMQRRLRAMP